MGLGLCDDTTSHPRTTSRVVPPTDSVLALVHICNPKGPERAPWQLEPLGTMQGAGHPDCFLRAIWKCLLVHCFLLSYLFILVWPFLKYKKG